jgi:hypothetical protein
MIEYTPHDWHWIVGGDPNRAWSSAARSYVTDYPSDRVSRIANEVELYDVLAKRGLASRAPQGPFTVGDVRAAFANIDAVATGAASDADALAVIAEEIGMTLPPLAD